MPTKPVNLNELKELLQHLRGHTLPVKTVHAVDDAIKLVGEIEKTLQESSENRRLAAVHEVSQSLGTTLMLDEVLNQVMDAVIALTGAERGFLMLQDPRTNTLILRAARNFDSERLEHSSMEVSRTIIRAVLDSGVGIVTSSALDDPRFAEEDSVILFALQSILCAPLRSRGTTIGVIYADSRASKGIFQDDDLELLNTFAVQAAVVIENARLYTQVDQDLAARVSELEILTQIDHELSQRLDLNYTIQITHKWALAGSGAKEAWIALSSRENPTLFIISGPDKGKILDPVPHLVHQALQESKLVQSDPINNTPARLVVPIVLANTPSGVIVLESDAPFSAGVLEFMARLATRAASAIENAQLYQEIQHANQAKSKFVSIVSHELRLPMTSIKGYADLIYKGMVGPVNEQQKEFLNIVLNNVDRMTALVSDLSDISRIETGSIKLEPTFFPIKISVQEVLESVSPNMEEKKQIIITTVPDDLPQVYADPNRVVQVMTNLVGNAWKYTPEEGKIQIQARADNEHVRISVIDFGIGISPEDQTQIFQQFFRSDDKVVRDQLGWGLGLSVSKQLVELMRGKIGFQSQIGKGSMFWFTLPLSAPQELELT